MLKAARPAERPSCWGKASKAEFEAALREKDEAGNSARQPFGEELRSLSYVEDYSKRLMELQICFSVTSRDISLMAELPSLRSIVA